ncbi:porin [Rhodococcus pyridinivorans]|uniref:MspA family porin n=1 Tax=Rhodococcus TaxID=1827 RepID=UPI00031D69C2|nr:MULTISPECIES: MspA family porin [Rhodococcus]AOD22085.1 porin [Rhodococcus sp. p52]AWZ24097.1 porin [Rhodococcus pyridinivorans]UGQ57488.1 MspA family porin [Rhodococcus pyridinivorans]
MKIQTRRGFRATRNATVAAAAVAGLVLGSAGAAGAEVNDQNRIVSNGHEVIVTQEDTFINGVPPIGGSPLSREWFHNGRGIANIVGPEAADFEGSTFQFGYQVAWTASVDGAIGFSWTSPDVELGLFPTTTPSYEEIDVPVLKDGQAQYVNEKGEPVGADAEGAILVTEKAYQKIEGGGETVVNTESTVSGILPQATAGIELTPAPGIEEIVVAEGEFDGDYKEVQIANIHGAATGVIGPVSLRPFVRVITENGDNVTTYGQVWTL